MVGSWLYKSGTQCQVGIVCKGEKGRERREEKRAHLTLRWAEEKELWAKRKSRAWPLLLHCVPDSYIPCLLYNHSQTTNKISFSYVAIWRNSRICLWAANPLCLFVLRRQVFPMTSFLWLIPLLLQTTCPLAPSHFWTQHTLLPNSGIWMFVLFPDSTSPVVLFVLGGLLYFVFVFSILCLIKFHLSNWRAS